MFKVVGIVLVTIVSIGLGIFFIAKTSSNNSTKTTPQADGYSVSVDKSSRADIITPTVIPTKSKNMNPSELSLDSTKTYTAQVKTSLGDFTIELSSKTPITSNNFVTLAEKGFYNNTVFHRVISGFMIQGGDPTGTGTGGPGYKFNDEPFEGEYTRGTVAMANAGPNTNGSQFFIMHADYPLPKNYVIFGKVTSGLETIDKIATAPVSVSSMGERSKPVEPVKITSVTITKK